MEINNPEFYYKRCHKSEGSLYLKPGRGEFCFYELLNALKENPPTDLAVSFMKVSCKKASLLLSQKKELEILIDTFLTEKIKLEKFATYPVDQAKDIFFSGSALTSLILNHLNSQHDFRYKDLDIYFFLKDDFDEEKEFAQHLKPETTYIKNTIFAVYPVMEEDVNLIWIKNCNAYAKKGFRDFFQDFDLSCNHIYFNMKTKELSWTPLFVEFISQSLIRINPGWDKFSVRSMIRAQKKAEEFKAKVAWDECELPLIRHLVFHNKIYLKEGDYLTKEHRQWMIENKLPFIEGKLGGEEELVISFKEEYAHIPRLLAALNKLVFLKRAWEPMRAGSRGLAKELILEHCADLASEAKLGSGSLPKNYFKKLSQLCESLPAFLWSREVFRNFKSTGYQNFRPCSLEAELITFWKPHGEFMAKAFAALGYDLFKLKAFALKVMSYSPRASHQQLKWIGFVEKAPNLKYTPSELTPLWEEFVILLAQTKKNLVPPLNLAKWAYQVSELVSQEELDLEGKAMRHCVAGYGSALSRGESRIFHLTTLKGGASTLELMPPSWKVRQHKSYHNQKPHAANEKLARRFIKFLKSQGK